MAEEVRTQALLELTTRALALAGRPAAAVVAHALVDAEVRGHPRFGLRLLEGVAAGTPEELRDRLRVDVARLEDRATITVDLAGKFAPAAVAALLEPARQRARDHGICLVRLLDVGPFGRLAPFVSAVAREGAIGLLTMSSRPFVAPTGGNRAVLGTNPFALGVPTTGHPLVVDTASSAITAAHWHDARAGLAGVPEGALVDAAGRPTADAAEAVAIAPRGGLLGTSVAIAVEALTAAATGLLSGPEGAARGGLLAVIEPANGAAVAGGELASRLTGAGGRLPGQPVSWPEWIVPDPVGLRVLGALAALS